MAEHKPAIAKRDIRSLSPDELAALASSMGVPAFRAKQLADWLFDKHATSFDEMTNLPKELRERLAEGWRIGLCDEAAKLESVDGSRKYLLRFDDGAAVECVGMPSGERLSVCVSTQAGCAMGCSFCATGAAGLVRSLSAEEIVAQALHIASDFRRRVSSVVLMGQGEPFANYEASIAACRALNSPDALGIGARHITISTCGIIGGITRLANEPEQFTLAVSLHSAVQETRNRLMPGVKRYPLPYLYEALGTYVEKTGRRPSYEYALIGGINDTDAELEALCDFCAGTLAHVNLIPLNEVEGSPFRPSAPGRAEEFVARLGRVGVEATIRNSRGADIDAACGQLSQKFKGATH